MAKKHKNLDNIPIQWDGDLTDPPYGAGNQGQSIPTSVDLGTWGGNSTVQDYTWNDVLFIITEVPGIGTHNRKERLDKLLKDKDKRKRLVHLICRVKGEKVYDEKKESGDMEIKLSDVDLVINEVLGTIKVSREKNYEVL